jgi:hypothetical protein
MTLRELLREKERLLAAHQQAQQDWWQAEDIVEKTRCFQRATAIFKEFERLPADEQCEDFVERRPQPERCWVVR